MNFKEAMKILRAGGKIIRPDWKKGSYWKLGQDETICWADDKSAHIHLNQIDAKDFEIYEYLNKQSLLTHKEMVEYGKIMFDMGRDFERKRKDDYLKKKEQTK